MLSKQAFAGRPDVWLKLHEKFTGLLPSDTLDWLCGQAKHGGLVTEQHWLPTSTDCSTRAKNLAAKHKDAKELMAVHKELTKKKQSQNAATEEES